MIGMDYHFPVVRRSNRFHLNFLDAIVKFERNHPRLAKLLFSCLLGICMLGIPFVWIAPVTILAIPIAVSILATIGFTLLAFGAITVRVLQHLFGGDMAAHDNPYLAETPPIVATDENTALLAADPSNNTDITHRDSPSGHAKFVNHPGHLPKIEIIADTPHDAGFIEGYALAPYMAKCFYALNKYTRLILPLIGAPRTDAALDAALQPIFKALPNYLQEEIQAKIAGYQAWRAENPNANPSPNITLGQYLLIQMLPDFHQYNPFKSAIADTLPNHGNLLPDMGCTSAIIQVDNMFGYMRALDWPSYGLAQYFIETERTIAGEKFTDISAPLLSGLLTAVKQTENGSQLFLQLNVSRNHEKTTVVGNRLPAILLNRKLLHEANTADEVRAMMSNAGSPQALSNYHVNVCDGISAYSIHVGQGSNGQLHEVESPKPLGSSSYLTVANHGFRGQDREIDHHDSTARCSNIEQFLFYKQNESQGNLIARHNDARSNQNEMIDTLLQIARLPMVNNFHTAVVALLVFHNGQLVDSTVATNNNFAAEREAFRAFASDFR